MNRSTAYWIATGLFSLVFVAGGVGHLFQLETIAASMEKLGYPAYVMTILGVAKLAGVAVLLAPGLPLLKEWAYAGFAIDLGGALASHVFVGDPIGESLAPVAVFALGAASYALRPAHLRLVPAEAESAPALVGAR